jgi:glucosylceramidase
MTSRQVTTHSRPPRERRKLLSLSVTAALIAAAGAYTLTQAAPSFAATSASVWLTTADQSNKLTQQAAVTFGSGGSGSVITVNPNTTYQTIVGFGGSMTDAAAYNIFNSPSRNTIMSNLFGSTGIGLSFLRQPIGTADFSRAFYSLDDGSSDPSLSRFSISKDQAYIIPILQQAKSLDPQLTFMASPWSAPGWMKTSGNMVGGSLSGGDEAVFAQYLTKFVQAYQGQGIPITYLSVANEPQYSPAAYPGMLMSASQESTIVNDLGPDLRSAGVSTKILAWDHNWDVPSYPEQVLASTGSNTAGVAWHHYAGNASAQTTVHNLYPSKETLETEGSWTSGTNWGAEINGQGGGTAINSLRNWSSTVTFWNLALNASGGPVIGNGCGCTAPVTTNGSSVTYNAEYYILGHFSKFVKPGAVHIDSNVVGTVNNVAFKNPDGTIALVAENTGGSSQTFQVSYGGSSFGYTLPAGAMVTFTWPGSGGGPSPSPSSTSSASPSPSPSPSSGNGSTGPVTGYQGLCLDVRGANSADGTPVQVYSCNGTNAQTWTAATDGTLQALGKCLDVSGAGTANGTLVQLYTCNGTGAQVWQHQSNGEYVNPNSGKCLDDTGSGGSGTQVQIWACGDGANQQWSLP